MSRWANLQVHVGICFLFMAAVIAYPWIPSWVTVSLGVVMLVSVVRVLWCEYYRREEVPYEKGSVTDL